MKKIFAGLLSISMVLTGLAGCGNSTVKSPGSSSKEPVTIVYTYAGNGMQTDTALVNEEMNKWLKNNPGTENITIKLNPCGGSGNDLKTTIMLAQASGEQNDICNSYGLTFSDYVNDQYAIPLDNLLTGTDVLKELPSWLMDLGKLNGSTYFVPNYQLPSTMRYLNVPAEYIKYYDGGAEAIRDVWLNPASTIKQKLETLHQLVLDVRKGTGKQTKWMAPSVYPGEYCDMECSVNTGSRDVILISGEDKAVNCWALDWYKDILETAADWYKEGIIHPDIATYTESNYTGANFLKDESLVATFGNAMSVTPENLNQIVKTKASGIDMVQIPLKTKYFTPGSWAAGGNWITSTCEHPEEAMKIIELLDTKKGTEFFNLLAYGIEGRQYTKNDDGSIRTLEYDGSQGPATTSYCIPGWEIGNTINQYENQSYVKGQKELIAAVGTSPLLVKSKIVGLMLDTSKITDEIAQITAVRKQYYNTLAFGITGNDWENKYNEMLSKLNTAGMQKVLDCVNAQYADYIK